MSPTLSPSSVTMSFLNPKSSRGCSSAHLWAVSPVIGCWVLDFTCWEMALFSCVCSCILFWDVVGSFQVLPLNCWSGPEGIYLTPPWLGTLQMMEWFPLSCWWPFSSLNGSLTGLHRLSTVRNQSPSVFRSAVIATYPLSIFQHLFLCSGLQAASHSFCSVARGMEIVVELAYTCLSLPCVYRLENHCSVTSTSQLFLIFSKYHYTIFLQRLHHFIMSPAMYRVSFSSHPSPTFVIFCVLKFFLSYSSYLLIL